MKNITVNIEESMAFNPELFSPPPTPSETLASISTTDYAPSEVDFNRRAKPVPAPWPLVAVKPKPHRILIADDDALVRGSLIAVLESEGYLADEARDGREAVKRAIAQRPDLVLLDLNMPGWDGWTAFTNLERVTPLLPVIVITARPNQYPKAAQLGVDAFMEKPLNIPILVGAIKDLMSEDRRHHEQRIGKRNFVTRLLDAPNE